MEGTERRVVSRGRGYVEFGAAAVMYLGVVGVVLGWLESHPASGLRVPVALLPLIPVGLVGWTVVRAVLREDERHRRIALESLAFAFVASGLTVITYAFLEEAGFPRLEAWWVWAVMASYWFASWLVAKWRYR